MICVKYDKMCVKYEKMCVNDVIWYVLITILSRTRVVLSMTIFLPFSKCFKKFNIFMSITLK